MVNPYDRVDTDAGTRHIAARVEPELAVLVKQMAKRQHRSVSSLIRHLLLQELEKQPEHVPDGIYSWEELMKAGSVPGKELKQVGSREPSE